MNGPPDLFVLAGPNGAGRTAFFERTLAPTGRDFINADRIAALRWPGTETEHGYEAAEEAEEAARLRGRYLDERRSFITETVFSHPPKVELLRRDRHRVRDARLRLVGTARSSVLRGGALPPRRRRRRTGVAGMGTARASGPLRLRPHGYPPCGPAGSVPRSVDPPP